MSDVRLILGDCMAVLPTLEAGSVDAVVTSPPYDDLRNYNGNSKFIFNDIARQLARVLTDGGIIVWIVSDQTINGCESGTSFRQALFFIEIGLNLHDTMIWHKQTAPLTHNRYEQHFEYMFILSKGSPKTFSPLTVKKEWKENRTIKQIRKNRDGSSDMGFVKKTGDKIAGNVWSIPNAANFAERYDHPAIFPEKLIRLHLSSWTRAGDITCDPFMGSGTTGVACVQTGRNFIGIEIDPNYYAIAEKRIAQAQLQMRMEI